VQLGSLACCLGPKAVAELITRFAAWMDEAGYADIGALCGDALHLFTMPREISENRRAALCSAYRAAQASPRLCTGCGQCREVCWYDAISLQDGIAVKSDACVGCGYCFQVCPAGALDVPAGDILAAAFKGRQR